MTALFEALAFAVTRRRKGPFRIAALSLLPLLLASALAGCMRSHDVPFHQAVLPPPNFAKPKVEAPPPAPTAQVQEAQRALAELGYRPGAADGVEGPHTQAAVRAFQDSAGLTADGRVSEALLAALGPALRTHRVTQVQRRLAALGYNAGTVDGQTGPLTRKAIRRFEADKGAAPTGKITPALLSLLARAEAGSVQWVARSGAVEQDAAQLEQSVTPGAGPGGSSAEGGHLLGIDELGEAKPLAAKIKVVARPDSKVVAKPGSQVAVALVEPEPGKHIILPGDTVRLRIGKEQVEVREFTVGLDGGLALPDGVTLQAAGLTPKQLEDLIMVKLVEVYLMGLEVDVMPPGAAAGGTASVNKAAVETVDE